MAVLDELMIKLGVTTDQPSFDRARASVQRLVDATSAVAAGVSAAVTSLFALARSTADYVDEVHDAATAIGMEAGALAQLRWAMTRTTGSAEGLEGALRILARTTQDAIDGGDASAAAFERVGVSVDDLRGRSPDEVLALIADGIAALPTATERTAVAMDLLGRSGGALVPMLAEGSAGMAALRAQAAELGIVISEETEAAAGDFNDTLDDLLTLGTGILRRIGNGVIPVFTRWGRAILATYRANRELIDLRIGHAIDLITTSLRMLEGPLGAIVLLFTGIASIRAAQTLTAIASALTSVGTGAGVASAGMSSLAGPLAVVLATILALNDWLALSEGRPSLTAELLARIGVSENGIARIALFASNVREAASAVESLLRLGAGFALGGLARSPFHQLFGTDRALTSAAQALTTGGAMIGPSDLTLRRIQREGMGRFDFAAQVDFARRAFGGEAFGGLSAQQAALQAGIDAGMIRPFEFGAQNMPSAPAMLQRPEVTVNVAVNGGDPGEVTRAVERGVREAYQQLPAAR